MSGQPLENCPESIRLFHLCDSMRWAVLPNAGGLYDQHPRLLEEWSVIFYERGKYQEKKQKEEARQMQARARRRR